MLLGCLRQQGLTVGINADLFDVRKGIAGKTAIKLMHNEIGILRRYDTDKNVYLRRNLGVTYWTFRLEN